MNLQHSGCDKTFSALITKPMFLRLCVSLTCYTSGKLKLVFINIFHMFHNFCVSKHITFVAQLWQNLCIFRTGDFMKYFPHLSQYMAFLLCEQTCALPGKLVLETFSRKACNFLCGSGFALLWLNLCIFKTVVVIKYFPHWSQSPCFKAFFSCVSLTCYTSGKLKLVFHMFHNFCVKNMSLLWPHCGKISAF